jgi:hypothetical protein
MKTISTRVSTLAVMAMAAIALFGAMGAQPAQAWGNRIVERPCGANAITSNPWANDAVTQKYNGSCTGQLGAGMLRSNGTVQRLRWGSSTYARSFGGSGNVGGAHFGCRGCGQSNT